MITKDSSGVDIIQLPDVSDIIHRYQQKLGIVPKFFSTLLDIENLRRVFNLAVIDLFNRRITEEEFSAVCEALLFNGSVWWPEDVDDRDKTLGRILLLGADLAYYHWRSNQFPDETESYSKAIKEIQNYFLNINKNEGML
ncbi:MAG: hypothetical protein N3A54_02180 [Patescibacteria group bacterium]|nr:hypothetical protein [Patescibacteria group bacterium]